MHDAKEGAFTGEVSPAMLSAIGVGYVVLGHSERRQYFNETDESVNSKVHAAFEYKLTPIVCVGESLEERESGKTVELVAGTSEESIRRHQRRLSGNKRSSLMSQFGQSEQEKRQLHKMRMKYVVQSARQSANSIMKQVADQIRIQYGGSVKPENIEELLAMEHIDGAFVGGASLEPAFILEIVRGWSK